MADFWAERVAFTTSTTGTGAIAVGSRLGTDFRVPSETSMPNGATVRYLAQESGIAAIIKGTYDSSGGGSFSRDSIICSVISGTWGTTNPTLASGAAEVRLLPPGPEEIAYFALLNVNNAFTGSNTFDKTQAALSGTITDNSAADFSTKQSWVADVNGSAFDLLNPSAAPTNDKTFISILFTYTTSHSVTAGSKFKSTGWTPTATSGKKDQTFWRYDSTADQYWLVSVRTDVAS